jgi:hypothetical protein
MQKYIMGKGEQRMNKKVVLCVVLILFLAETSLLSADHQHAQLTTLANVNPTLNNSNLASSYDNGTTHEGDLVISGTQTYVIENCTYIQTGNIYVRNYAKLVARNATFQISQIYVNQYEFRVDDYATLEFKNVSVTSAYGLNWYFLGYTKANFDNVSVGLGDFSALSFSGFSQANINSVTFKGSHGINAADHSELFMANSSIGSLEVTAETPVVKITESNITWRFALWFSHDSNVNISQLAPGFQGFLDLNEKVRVYRDGSYLPMQITLNQTQIYGWHINAWYDSKTMISESTILWFGIFALGLSAQIEDLKPQFYEYKEVGQITLNKTDIVSSVAVRCDEDSDITITNSTVGLPFGSNPNAKRSGHISMTDSVFDGLHAQSFPGTNLSFEGTTFRGGMNLINAVLFISGNLSFDKKTLGIVWYSSNITREYDANVRDNSGDSTSNVGLSLFDKSGALVWNGITNSLGQADFNLTFTDNNYTDTLKLNISKEGFYNETKDVAFLSDTPVSIVLTEKILGDLNSDRWVSLADLVILARAYGSKPGDSNWNPNADIDGNGIVGLSDLVILAQNYGRTA